MKVLLTIPFFCGSSRFRVNPKGTTIPDKYFDLLPPKTKVLEAPEGREKDLDKDGLVKSVAKEDKKAAEEKAAAHAKAAADKKEPKPLKHGEPVLAKTST